MASVKELDEMLALGSITKEVYSFKKNQIIYGEGYTGEIHEELTQLDELLAEKYLSQENYEIKKKEILEKVNLHSLPPNIKEKLQQLDELVADDTITKEVYKKKRSELIAGVDLGAGVKNNQNKSAWEQEQVAQLEELYGEGAITAEVFHTKKAKFSWYNLAGHAPEPVKEHEPEPVKEHTPEPVKEHVVPTPEVTEPAQNTSVEVKTEATPDHTATQTPTPVEPQTTEPVVEVEFYSQPKVPVHETATIVTENALVPDTKLTPEPSSETLEPKLKEKEDSPIIENLDDYPDIKEKILQLHELYIDGLLSKDEYENKKKEYIAKKPVPENTANYSLELKEKIAQLDELLQDKILLQVDYDRKKKQFIQTSVSGLDPATLAQLAQLEELLKDGVLTQQEYEKRKKELEGPSEKEKAHKIFKYFNKEGNGKIDVKEFQALCFEMGEVFTSAEVQKAVTQIDLDGDGFIDFEEFYSWWTNKSAGDKPVNQRLHFLRMKLQSESYLRTIKGITDKLRAPSKGGTSLLVDSTITFGNFKKRECGIKVVSSNSKARVSEIREITGVSQADSVAFAIVDLKSGVNTGLLKTLMELMKPFMKDIAKDALQVKLHTTADQTTQLIMYLVLSPDSDKGSVLGSSNIWDHIKLELDIDFDQTPSNPNSETLGIQVKAKGSVNRDIIDQLKQFKSDPLVPQMIKLFKFGKFNLRLAPIDQILHRLISKDMEQAKKLKKKKTKPEDSKASPYPTIKGWPSIKEGLASFVYKILLSEKFCRENVGLYWQILSMAEKINSVGFVVKDTIVDLTLQNINIFDLFPTKLDLGFGCPEPKQQIRDDLKLYAFDVHSPARSKKRFTAKSSSSSSSSDEDGDPKKNDENENEGKFSKNYKSILLPNLRYFQNDDNGPFTLLFESHVPFNISHIIVKTPRFANCPLRRVLFYAFNSDPRLKQADADDSSDDELPGVLNKKTKRVIWPPEVAANKPVPFCYIEIPANQFYVEQKLPQNVTGNFIKAIVLDGWEIEQVTGMHILRSIRRSSNKKISIEFIGFIGPADPGEIVRDVGAKFGVFH